MADTATLTVASIEDVCAEQPFSSGERGCIHFASEPDKPKGGPNRHVVEVQVTGAASERGTVEIDGDGHGVYYYRTGIQGSSGLPYSTGFSAYVAHYGTRQTPISEVITGPLP